MSEPIGAVQQEGRTAMLLEQTVCDDPDAGTTSGLVAYLEGGGLGRGRAPDGVPQIAHLRRAVERSG